MISLKIYSSFLLVLSVYILHSSADSRLVVKQHPSYHEYNYANSGSLRVSDLKEMLLAVNGFSINKLIEWKGLKSTNSLASPKVTLLFLADSEKTETLSEQSIPINNDALVDFEYLKKYYESSNGLFRTSESLPTINELKQLECSKTLDSVFYVVRLSEADYEDMEKKINSVVEAFSGNCLVQEKDDLLVYVLATDSNQRVKRDLGREKRALGSSILNRAILYSDNYPVTFHLIFWTSLILGLAVVGTVCGMYQMDPGLDTVIYRMTSQRIKKDN